MTAWRRRKPIPTTLFRPIQRFIRLPHQTLGDRGWLGDGRGDAKADGDVGGGRRTAVGDAEGADGVEDAVGHARRFLERAMAEEDDELLAAETGHDIGGAGD